MPRRAGSQNETTTTPNGVALVQVSARIRPEQDMMLTMISRMRGIDKGLLVQQSVDLYINSLPKSTVEALALAAMELAKDPNQPELVTAE